MSLYWIVVLSLSEKLEKNPRDKMALDKDLKLVEILF
jgi:hypothetical protein